MNCKKLSLTKSQWQLVIMLTVLESAIIIGTIYLITL